MKTIPGVSTALAAGLAALALGGCTALLDAQECETESDCTQAHSRGYMCTDEGLCQQKPLLQTQEEGPCSQKSGPIDEPDAFNIGVLLPLSGPEAGFGQPLLNAIELAQNNFNELDGVEGRKLGLIICDTQGKDDLALVGARHLVDSAAVEAIIGPDYSSQTIDVAQQWTIDKQVLLVTPSGTATTISGLDDDNLVWRTTPSDELQGRALGEMVGYILDTEFADTRNSAKVAVLARKDDVYANGLREGLVSHLPADIRDDDTGHRYTPLEYQNSSAGGGTDYSGVVAALTAQQVEPDVVVVLGSGEAWQIPRSLDEALDKEPIYLFADAAKNNAEASATSAALEGRIWGTAPRNVGDSDYVPWQSFRSAYQSAYQQNPGDYQFVANAYDALYVIALGAAGSGYTGPQIAAGIEKLSSGTPINANQTDLSEGLTARGNGQSIDLQGASGPLDFDEDGNPTVGEVSLWCFDDGGVPEKGVILKHNGKFNARSCQQDIRQ